MANTTPNKETVRRICLLHGATICRLLINTDDDHVEVLTDISTNKLANFQKEVESWSGMKFRVFNTTSDIKKIQKIKLSGEIIFPIKL